MDNKWHAYKLIYQAVSPISIGYYKLGFIERTRYYIPGMSIWGAITANLARYLELDCTNHLERHYEEIGTQLLNKYILVSYFYPALRDNSLRFRPLVPKFTDNGLSFGEYSIKEFERLFIRSFGQTAIEPKYYTAEEGSLHEIEFIIPNIEEGNEQKKVYFLGYIFIKDEARYREKTVGFDKSDSKEIKLKDVISEIFVGKDRGYGFGRLVLSSYRKINPSEDYLFDYLQLNLSGEKVEIKIKKGEPIPAHLPFSTNIRIKGDIEPLVARRWESLSEDSRKYGAGQKISKMGIYWIPGSILECEDEISFCVGNFGILYN